MDSSASAALAPELPNNIELDPLTGFAVVDCRPILISDAILPARRRLLAVFDRARPLLAEGVGARKGDRDGRAY
jgi:hypothetical protein